MQPLPPKKTPQLALIGPSLDHAAFMPPAQREKTLAKAQELKTVDVDLPTFKIVHDPASATSQTHDSPKLTKKGHRFLFRRRERS